MFISPSSLALNHILPASGNIHSATAGPFPESLPLSTPLPSPPNQPSAPPSSYTHLSPSSRSPSPSESLSTMPPSGTLVPPSVTISFSQSSPSVSPPSDLPEPTTDTRASAGTSLPPSSASSSNSDVSVPLPSWSTASGTTSAILSHLSLSHSTNPPFTSGLTFISTPISATSFSTTSTMQTFSLPATVSSSASSQSTSSLLLPSPVSTSSTLVPTSAITGSPSAAPDSTTTILFSTTLVTPVTSPSDSSPNLPSTSTYTIISTLWGQGATTTDFVTTSSVLSTESPGTIVNGTLSPGTIAAIVLGIVGAFAFSALWLFCARRRHRTLAREAALIQPEHHAPGPLDDEMLDVDELGYGIGSTHSTENPTNLTVPAMEERYAGILAALHSTEGFASGNERGSTGGIYGSRHGTTIDMDEDIARASSPTLPLHILPDSDDPLYMVPLSPPPPVSQPLPHETTQPVPPPSAYYTASRRKSSPGPDAAAWLGGYSVAPSYHSHYTRSQTLGSGSLSGSVDALTRTRTGSEEPLLGVAKPIPEVSIGGGASPTTVTDPGGNRTGLGSAFNSPATSLYSPSSAYPTLQYDTSGSHGTRSASGSGSYGYAHSGAPSSFDVLRSVSSQGALSSAYSQGHGQSQRFGFGFNRGGSLSSDSIGKKAGSNRHSFGVPPTSFKARKDRGSTASDKEKLAEKQSLREKDWKPRPRSWTSSASASGSVDEKQGRASPVVGVRALLGRLRRAGHTPSPHSSDKDLPSPTKASTDVDLEKAVADRATPPPVQVVAATPHRRRFSFILSNPDPHPPSPYSGADVIPSSPTPPYQELRPIQREVSSDPYESKLVAGGEVQPTLTFPTRYMLAHAPSPAPTEESRLAEGLLHPRLRTQGHSDASLRDFEDYSRPIGGVVKNRLYSTTTFGTQDEVEGSPSQGTLVPDSLPSDEHGHEDDVVDVFRVPTRRAVPRDSWFIDDRSPPITARHLPAGP